jgi:hypothetical protein
MIPLACLRGRALHRRRRAGSRRQAQGGRTEGRFVKILKVSRSPAQKDSSLFCKLIQHLVKSIKIVEKSKNSKHNFAVLSVTRTSTLSKYVYTFEV